MQELHLELGLGLMLLCPCAPVPKPPVGTWKSDLLVFRSQGLILLVPRDCTALAVLCTTVPAGGRFAFAELRQERGDSGLDDGAKTLAQQQPCGR